MKKRSEARFHLDCRLHHFKITDCLSLILHVLGAAAAAADKPVDNRFSEWTLSG